MTVKPTIQTILDDLQALAAPPVETLTPEAARNGMVQKSASLDRPEDLASVEDAEIPGPATAIPVRVYTPKGDGPFPVLVYYHGGGWMCGDLETHDGYCRHLAIRCGALVVSIHYRRPPEDRFPAAAEDCYAATAWVAENAANWHGDASRLAVGGDSAGGNLAAVVSIMAKERGGPRIRCQVLLYPVIEPDFETASYRENATGYSLTRSMMQWFWDAYAPNPQDRLHRHAAPSRAPDLSGLPPAYVITAEYDPLRDEGESYAHRLEQAGVTVTLERWDGMIHGFVRWTEAVEEARQLLDKIREQLDRAFSSDT